ncbi:hypothetical protein, partial [Okeania sp. SIO2C9]|uniref:hypothetical protein n=1 Tax=Okeania sp. SIO2C9 TaxID=2607791 RepID=UPI0025ED661E
LQDRSFKNQYLTNQDFSYADIRGANFTEKLWVCASPWIGDNKRSFAQHDLGWDGEVSEPYPIDSCEEKFS